MATLDDARRLAAALPAVETSADGLAFSVRRGAKAKGFAWAWRERVHSKRPKVPNLGVLAVRVASVAQRDLMVAAEPSKFFTEPHYDGFPAVLVRLAAVSAADLEVLLVEGRRCQAAPPRPPTRTPARTPGRGRSS